MCLVRIDKSHLTEENLVAHINKFIEDNELDVKNTDILVDLGIVDDGEVAKAKQIIDQLKLLPKIESWRSFIVSGGAFPKDLTEFKPHDDNKQDRYDWKLWRKIKSSADLDRQPTFSDYTIQHPIFYDPVPNARASASVRYTEDRQWWILRGKNPAGREYFDKKTGKRTGKKYTDQYFGHAQSICDSSSYKKESFSYGDSRIKEIAAPTNKKPGNPQTWLTIGINHHLTLVAQQTSGGV